MIIHRNKVMENAPDVAPQGEVEEALQQAVRNKMLALLDKPMTPRTLLEVEQMARLGREMIAVGLDPRALRTRGQVFSGINLGTEGIYDDEDGLTMAPSSKAETFAASFIRQLVALNSSKNQTPEELIKAIAMAKEKGLDTIAANLEKQLMGEVEPKSLPEKKEEPIETEAEQAAQ